ncbi:MAG: phenylalanine--tRNA ligase subunit beta [Armatimonadetes bacterium]|nr:phenylalanine--tRNA ligase subunit beta [Armatimonadota bacterium]MDW8121044.1 phenylalanine--tRNA ligase subunit beta [Armatimonadota bacterium]
MKVPLSWLKEFVEISEPLTELLRILEKAGLTVESLEERDGDWIFDLEITPNRPDWLSVYGIAREIAAFLDRPLRPINFSVTEEGGDAREIIAIRVDEPELCPRYSARVVDCVTVAESPEWLKKRLEACGLRPICNIVDITNYVLLEMGHPLHAFDAASLKGGQIIVRRARAGERLWTLDEQERILDTDTLVIADAERPVAIAGVMGGLETGITPFTQRVIIESAHFNPISIRMTARRLGMVTESSYRFERWVDPSGTVRAADRAAALMASLAGGRILSPVLDFYPNPIPPQQVHLRPERVQRLLGVAVGGDECAHFLQRLGLTVQSDGQVLQVFVPTFRKDITREADLIEEVARLYGYDRIPSHLPEGSVSGAGDSVRRNQENAVKQFLCRLGLREVVTYSLTHPSVEFGWGVNRSDSSLSLVNPLTQDYTVLRISLLPSLLEVLSHNIRMGVRDIWIFEIGRKYQKGTVGKMEETEPRLLAIALTGSSQPHGWNLPPAMGVADFYTLKGIVEKLFGWLSVGEIAFVPGGPGIFHPYRCATIVCSGESLGAIGQLHPAVAERKEVPSDIFLAEIDFERLVALAHWQRIYRTLPLTPSIRRDIAVIVPDEVPSATVEQVITQEAGPLLEESWVFDEYRGTAVPSGHRSIAYALVLRAADRTLTQSEADEIVQRVKDRLKADLGLQTRG